MKKSFTKLSVLISGLLFLSTTASAQNFQVPVEVSDGVHEMVLTIGVHPNGSSGYDPGLDLFAPPPPPGGAFDARLSWMGEDYFTDIRDNSLVEKEFLFSFVAAQNAGPVQLSWDNTGLAGLGIFEICDKQSGGLVSLNMAQMNTLQVQQYPLLQNGLKIKVTPAASSGLPDSREVAGLQQDFELLAAFPNPFNMTVNIPYRIVRPARISIQILSLNGEIIQNLKQDFLLPGSYIARWDGKSKGGDIVATGIYYCVVATASQKQIRKLLLIK
ncbi:MAG: hypothetical protein WAN36_07740 [Calditrichia bacterium]